MNKIVIFIVALVLLGLGGFAFIQQKNKALYGSYENANPTESVSTTSTETIVTTTTSTPTPTPTPTPTAPRLTKEEVAKHNSTSSCYSIINSGVYDLTSWVAKHPGGQSAILGICGKDGTSAFMSQHGGGQKQIDLLATFKIGALVQ